MLNKHKVRPGRTVLIQNKILLGENGVKSQGDREWFEGKKNDATRAQKQLRQKWQVTWEVANNTEAMLEKRAWLVCNHYSWGRTTVDAKSQGKVLKYLPQISSIVGYHEETGKHINWVAKLTSPARGRWTVHESRPQILRKSEHHLYGIQTRTSHSLSVRNSMP